MATKAKSVDVKKTGAAEGGKKEVAARAATYPFLGLRDEIDRVFDRFMGDGWMTPNLRRLWDMGPSGGFGALTGAPRADFAESDKEYELTVELPGMDEKDIEVTLSDDVITLKGEKKEEKETKEKDYHLTERTYGAVQRSFTIPSGVDPAKVSASFSKGVLKVSLPKTAEAQAKPRKISVKSA